MKKTSCPLKACQEAGFMVSCMEGVFTYFGENWFSPLFRILTGPEGSFSLASKKAAPKSLFLEQKGTLLLSPLEAALSSWLANMIKCHLSLTSVPPKQPKWIKRLVLPKSDGAESPQPRRAVIAHRAGAGVYYRFSGLVPIWGEMKQIIMLFPFKQPARIPCRLRGTPSEGGWTIWLTKARLSEVRTRTLLEKRNPFPLASQGLSASSFL